MMSGDEMSFDPGTYSVGYDDGGTQGEMGLTGQRWSV